MLNVKQDISSKFDAKDMGELHHFLGVKVVQNHETEKKYGSDNLHL